jgi:hypothetical protein
MRLIFTLMLVIGCLQFTSCEKDNVIPRYEDGCYDFGDSPSFYGYSYLQDDTIYRLPFFISSTSIAYIFISPNYRECRTLDMQTQTETSVPASLSNIPDCSKTGWILCSGNGFISKVKANGDSLTHLIPFSGFTYLRWRPDGERFLFTIGPKTIIADKYGNVVDTLPFYTSYGDWSDDGNKICSGNGDKIQIWNFNTRSISEIGVNVSQGGIIGVRWADNDRLIWNHRTGIYILSQSSPSNVRQIRQSCESRFWWSFEVAPDGNSLICGRVNAKLFNETTIAQRERVYLIRVSDGGIIWSN